MLMCELGFSFHSNPPSMLNILDGEICGKTCILACLSFFLLSSIEKSNFVELGSANPAAKESIKLNQCIDRIGSGLILTCKEPLALDVFLNCSNVSCSLLVLDEMTGIENYCLRIKTNIGMQSYKGGIYSHAVCVNNTKKVHSLKDTRMKQRVCREILMMCSDQIFHCKSLQAF